MTDQQFIQLIALLEKVINKQFTITGAADWPLLVVLGGLIATLVSTLVCLMWRDLKGSISSLKMDFKEELKAYKEDNDKSHDIIWAEIKRIERDFK